MTKLILLIGLPGSGKSTLAKQLLTECSQMQLIS
ncbi:MAG: AAA family ATPase, partial [Dolichospermum sp.]